VHTPTRNELEPSQSYPGEHTMALVEEWSHE
jgi:hypothetical protein